MAALAGLVRMERPALACTVSVKQTLIVILIIAAVAGMFAVGLGLCVVMESAQMVIQIPAIVMVAV